MTLDELMQKLASADLYPIPVEGDGDHDLGRGLFGHSRGWVFRGDLDGFIKAAKALDCRCVSVVTRTLEESDFVYQESYPSLNSGTVGKRRMGTDSENDVDLCDVDPALLEFKAHLGGACGFRIAVMQTESLSDKGVISPFFGNGTLADRPWGRAD
jgi:hypothetical protein